MNRRVLGVLLIAVLVARAERAAAQKYQIDDPVPPDAKGLVLSMSGEVRTIQGLASRFIPRIEGSYSNVVGLPVAAVVELMHDVERSA